MISNLTLNTNQELQQSENNINISEVLREKEYLTAVRDDFISNVYNYVPLKSVTSNVSEETYCQTIKDALLDITNQRLQLNKIQKLKSESVDTTYLQEEKLASAKNDLVTYIQEHSENKDSNLISQDISALLDEIYNTDLKIESIETFINEVKNDTALAVASIFLNEDNKLDSESLLSSSIASLEQNTITCDFKHEPSNNTLSQILISM
ncbi:hypothetical protein ACON3F_18465 [Providencia hangzhouensis]|uniref:hypothetical protein n=1 Tax=Providencia TaxID=586 RepID=UPI000D9DF3FA|nr:MULTISPECIES: hypothetical protein [Providencia]MRF67936.1 hypothetical protein [Escherichia coli]QIF65602.1 hypothetical protein FVA72_08790 [Providencia sp. 1709051003]PYZ59795.1 hypothetical protein DNK63_12015 [Providencia rettgeri]QNP20130.1 hypothetical protein H9L31_20115 [Providencia rettgeri]WOB96782.1 hypothetical protein P3L54_08225 [Providencia sp. PROV099]